MKPTKEKLIQICNELFNKGIISTGELRDRKYDVCNGHVNFSIPKNAYKDALKENFEKLGYTFKHAGFSYYEVYWKEDTSHIDEIFSKYE